MTPADKKQFDKQAAALSAHLKDEKKLRKPASTRETWQQEFLKSIHKQIVTALDLKYSNSEISEMIEKFFGKKITSQTVGRYIRLKNLRKKKSI